MLPELRKIVTFDEDIHREGIRTADPALRMIGVAAVVTNPWAGQGYVENLGPEIARMAPPLGKMLTERLIALAGSGEAIEAYGKACIAGVNCELEHASALIHTLNLEIFIAKLLEQKAI
jgi:hypothetical protein